MRQFLWIIHFRSFSHTNIRIIHPVAGPKMNAHLNILHEIYIHFNMYFECYCCYYYNFNFINCAVLVFFFVRSFFLSVSLWLVFLYFYCDCGSSPLWRGNSQPCMCPYFTISRVRKRDFLLFLCVVVECSLLRVNIIYYRTCSNVACVCSF